MEATPLSAFKITGTRIDAFVGKGITNVVIPYGITDIGDEAFRYTVHPAAAGIKTAYIPDSVASIGECAFLFCKELECVRIPANLQALRPGVFSGCESLESIHLPKNLRTIGGSAFSMTNIRNVVIPAQVREIGRGAFYSCHSLERITIPSNVRSIGERAFENCTKLTIYTTSGSFAESYAQLHGIPVAIITNSAMAAELVAAQEKYQTMQAQMTNATGKNSIATTNTKQDTVQTPAVKTKMTSNTVHERNGENETSRKFFRIDLRNLRQFFLKESFLASSSEMCYGSFRLKDIVIQHKTLFRDELVLKLPYSLYAYEENGTFYEFFSGKFIGERRVHAGTSYYRNPDEIVRKGYILTSFRDFGSYDYTIRELAAVQFADEVGQFVPYKSHMASEMSKLLDAIDANYNRLTDAANAKKNAEIRAEQNSQSWLDDIINRR